MAGQIFTPVDQCQEDLAAARQQIQELETRLAFANAFLRGLQDQVNILTDQNAQLRGRVDTLNQVIADLQSQLATANTTIDSLVLRVFGAPPDANVAGAARDVAQEAIRQTIAVVGERDQRVRRAQRNSDEGIAALAAGNYREAVREFDQAYTIAQRILSR